MTASSCASASGSQPAARITGPQTPRTSMPARRGRRESMSAAPSWSPEVSPATTPRRGARTATALRGTMPSAYQAAGRAGDELDERADLRLAGRLRRERGHRFGQRQVAPIQRAVGLADIADLPGTEIASLQALAVHRMRRRSEEHTSE